MKINKERFAAVLDAYCSGPQEQIFFDLRPIAKAHRALPVYANIGGALMIRTEGTWDVLAFDWDTRSVSEEYQQRWIDVAYQHAVERYPEIFDV